MQLFSFSLTVHELSQDLKGKNILPSLYRPAHLILFSKSTGLGCSLKNFPEMFPILSFEPCWLLGSSMRKHCLKLYQLFITTQYFTVWEHFCLLNYSLHQQLYQMPVTGGFYSWIIDPYLHKNTVFDSKENTGIHFLVIDSEVCGLSWGIISLWQCFCIFNCYLFSIFTYYYDKEAEQ